MTLTSGEPELPDAPAEPWPRAAHLIGVAGAGMQSLAALLLERGCRVSGSDLNRPPEELVARGLTFTLGHAAEHVPPEADMVIYSAAVVENNVERKQAARRGIPQVSYPEMLGRISAATPTLAVAGTHGKSTTCAMLVEIYRAAGLDPSHLYGATPIVPSAGQATSVSSTREHGLPGNGRAMFGGHAGRDALLIAEACEFRRHFWQLSPRAAAILAVEPDHFDCYPTPRDLLAGFAEFAARVPSDGVLAYWADDAHACQVVAAAACRRKVGFGLGSGCTWRAAALRQEEACYAFTLLRDGEPWAEIRLAVPGRHQVINALAAATLAAEQGLPPEAIAGGLAGFAGLRRRMEIVGQVGGAVVIDDYAHHPTELAAALETVRAMFGDRRLTLIFQPHQASRTARLLDELAGCLHNADRAYICDVYRAREGPPQPGEASAADLARVAQAAGACAQTIAVTQLPQLAQTLTADDVVLAAGAGDLGKWIDELVRRFGSRCQNQ